MHTELQRGVGQLRYNAKRASPEIRHNGEDKLVAVEATLAAQTRELLELSRHLIRVAEEEKAKLARNLHDELGSSLTAINIDIDYVAERLNGSQPHLAKRLQRAADTLRSLIKLKRRLVQDLWPTMLDHFGLPAALQVHCEDFCARAGLTCTVDAPEELGDIDPARSIALYRVAQESLTNIARHAQATAVKVELKRELEGVRLQLMDDGIGIAIDAMNKPASYGLIGMRARISQLGGMFDIRRSARTEGTLVTAFIPR